MRSVGFLKPREAAWCVSRTDTRLRGPNPRVR